MRPALPTKAVISLDEELRRIGRITLHAVIATVVLITIVSSVLVGLLSLIDNGRLQARVLAEGMSAPMAFDDRASADELLQSLGRQPTIDGATIYLQSELVFSRYVPNVADRGGVSMTWLLPVLPSFLRQIEVIEPVVFNQRILGRVHLKVSLRSLYWQTLWLLGSALLAAIAAFGISRWLARRLNGAVVSPLVELEDVTRKIAHTVDYKQRAGNGQIAEVNALAMSFNMMLEQLEQRDAKLAIHREELEQLVVSRTAELSKAKEVAEAASRAKSEFLATMSHEIRTPLSVVLGMNELLSDSPLSSAQREWVDFIQGAGRQLMQVINDVLDFSKIEAGQIMLETIEFDLLELVEDCMVNFASVADAKSLELVAELPLDGKPLMLCGDSFRLRQVIANLLSNAIKFTKQGSVIVRVSCGDAIDELVPVHLCVEDSGIGISAEAHDRIFEHFSQVDSSTTREFGGSGLGLAICKRLLTIMGGDIRCESELGHGTKFLVDLHLARSHKPLANASSTRELAGRRVLLAVAGLKRSKALQRIYSAWGMQVTVTYHDTEVPQLLRSAAHQRDSFDLVVLEAKPSSEATEPWAALEAVLQIDSDIPVVLIRAISVKPPASLNGMILPTVTWPVRSSVMFQAVLDALQISQPQESPQAPEPVIALSGKVLLVEDNFINQRLATAMLASFGIEVVLAANGQEALEQLDCQNVDLVLMDCQMPVMDGYQATMAMRRLTEGAANRLPIVALTANAMREDEQKCLDAGMDDFLSKPFTGAELWEKLTRWLPTKKSTSFIKAAVQADVAATKLKEVIKSEQIEFLRRLDPQGGNGLLRELLTSFVTLTEKTLLEVESAVSSGDVKRIVSLSHTIKSASNNVGLELLGDLYRQIEAEGRVGNVRQVAELLPSLREVHWKTMDCIAVYLN